ncbi:serrate RNA effector molecule homolog, partial [Chiloscyllium plagiosum]|uniref:serrate RNA effector molecule homolog n=1 Tax=Chiloscyllium plagiosum TaxID=36176 RepID=UPI001CB849DF
MTSTSKFRSKYHPDEAGKRKQEADYGLRTRLSVYCYLMEHSWFEGLSLDIDKANIIMKALDAAVIKMEGGTENDVKILELEDEEEKAEKSEPGKKEEGRLMDSDKKVVEKEDASKKAETSQPAEEEKKDKEDGKSKESPGQEEEEKGEEGEEKDDTEQSQVVKESPVSVKAVKKRKRKRSGEDSYDEDDASRSDSESECEVALTTGERTEQDPSGKPKGEGEKSQKEARAQLRDCELSPVVNRDLARRVRSINGITQHKQIVRNDIKLAAKLIHSLDDRSQLWSSETVTEEGRVE